jgi:hypothetical protein
MGAPPFVGVASFYHFIMRQLPAFSKHFLAGAWQFTGLA